jgi:hypothetical protein
MIDKGSSIKVACDLETRSEIQVDESDELAASR